MSGALTEFELIARLRSGLGADRADTLVGIGDDAALLQTDGAGLAVAMDTLVAGVHFPTQTDPADLGWKALAVNLSDLAAMGASPQWALLSLTLPTVDADWIDRFVAGWRQLADSVGLQLVGGDSCRGPLSISVTAMGSVGSRRLLRSGAQAGDDLYLSGSVGDAAAGLALCQQRLQGVGAVADQTYLLARLNRPQPRCQLGVVLAGLASAAIDVSDGLIADAGHLLRASGLAATLDLQQLTPSAPLTAVVTDPAKRLHCMLNGGDDYELLFSAAPAMAAQVQQLAEQCATPVRRIGRLHRGESGLLYPGPGQQALSAQGWDHFR